MAATTLDRVTNRVKEDWVVGLAKKLIDIPSFKTEESQVALFLASKFRRWGYEVDLAGGGPGALPGHRDAAGHGGRQYPDAERAHRHGPALDGMEAGPVDVHR